MARAGAPQPADLTPNQIKAAALSEAARALSRFMKFAHVPDDVCTLYNRHKDTKPREVAAFVFEHAFTTLHTSGPDTLEPLKAAIKAGATPLQVFKIWSHPGHAETGANWQGKSEAGPPRANSKNPDKEAKHRAAYFMAAAVWIATKGKF